MMIARWLSALIITLTFGLPAIASNSGVTYQGRILRPDGSPISGATTQFKLQIRTPDSNNCLMYEEIQSLDLRNTNGQFSLTINDGNGSRTDSTGLNLDRIFANRGTLSFNASTCSAGNAYTPNQSDGRVLVVLFKDETMGSWEPIPAQKINFVPFAFEAKQIAGFTADSLLRVVDGSGDPLPGLAPLSNAQYTALMALANGSSTAYTKANELRGSAVPTMTAGEVLGWNGSAWVSTTSTPGASSVTTAMLQGGAVTGAKLDPAISISTSGSIASAITTTRDFKIYAASPSAFFVGQMAPASLAASYTLTWPLTAGASGQVLTTDGTGALTWTSASAAGISSLTGDVTATGPGAAAATVTTVGGVTAANIATGANLANAATNLNTASTLVRRDASGNFAAGAVTQGSSIYKDSGSNTVTVQAPTTVGSSYVLKLPTGVAAAAGQVLTSDTSGNLSWTTMSGAPTGNAGGDLSGTYPNPGVALVGTSTAANVHAAELLANAATAANTASAIVKRDGSGNFMATDITTSSVKTDTLKLNNAGSVVNVVNPIGAAYTLTLPGGAGSAGQLLSTNGSGVTSWVAPVIGSQWTTQAPGINYMGGNVGIGTTSPAHKLHVVGTGGFDDSIYLKATGAGAGDFGTYAIENNLGDVGQYSLTSSTYSSAPAVGPRALSLYSSAPGGAVIVSDHATASLRFVTGGTALANERMRIESGGNVGIGTTLPATKLAVSGSLRVGDGGETCDSSITGAIRYNGGNLQFCAGAMPWTTLGVSGAGISSLTGDVTATGPGAATATVAQVGGVTAANVAAGANLANAATNLNTASTLVKRDAQGNFNAGAVSVVSTIYRDSGSKTVTVSAPTTVSTTYALKLPAAVAAASGQVLTSDTSGNLSWTTPSTAPTGAAGGDLSGTYPNPGVALVGTSTAANVHAAELLANAATSANTASTIVKRDASGNFTATDVTTSSLKADTLKLNNAGSVVNVVNPTGAAYTLTLPTGTGSAGQVLSTNGAGITSWIVPSGGSQWTTQAPGINYMSGNVGIGTTSPGQKLTVAGTVESTTGGFKFPDGTTQSSAAGPTFWTDAGSGILTYPYGVGIGTSTPNGMFEVNGAIIANGGSGGIFYANRSSGTSTAGMYYTTGFGGDWFAGMTGDSDFRIKRYSTDVFVVKTDGKVGIGTTAPNGKFDVKGSIVMSGSTGGYTGFQPAAVAGSTIWTLPTADGSSGQVMQTNGSGILSWITPSSGGITALTGDVTASGTGSVAAAVATVGGVTAANVAAGANLANAATNANTVSTIIKRDASGNFAASAVTHTSSIFKDTGSNTVTLQAPTTVSSSYVLRLPTGVAAAAGQVLSSDTSGNLSWVTASGAPSGAAGGDLSGTYPNPGVALVGTSTAANVHAAELLANAATASSTNNTIVKRDGSQNFAANIATLNGLALNNAGSVLNLVNPIGAAYTLTLPTGTGTSGQVLSTNGSGVTSWITPAGGSSQWTTQAPGINYMGGNVGIGTTSPFRPLHLKTPLNSINGIALEADNSAPNSLLSVITLNRNATGESSGAIGFLSGSDTIDGAISFHTHMPGSTGHPLSDFERMRIDPVGNVGIGTTSPTSTLHVIGKGSFSDSIGVGTIASGWPSIALNPNMPQMIGQAAADTYFPGSDLFVKAGDAGAATADALGGTLYLNAGSSTGTQGSMIVFSTAAGASSGTAYNNAAERLRIDRFGKVGIGTTAPRVALDVNGVISGKAAVDRTSATTIDFLSANIQYSTDSCQAYQLNNLKDGTTYTFVVKGSVSATCSFTTYSDGGLSALTPHLPPGHGATTFGKHTLYSLMVVGPDVYFSWIPGY